REAMAAPPARSDPSPEDPSELSVVVRPIVPAATVSDDTLTGRGDEPTRLRVRPPDREVPRPRMPAAWIAATIAATAAVAAVASLVQPTTRRPSAVAVAPVDHAAPATSPPARLAWSAIRPLAAEVPVREGSRARFKTRARGAGPSAAPRWSV